MDSRNIYIITNSKLASWDINRGQKSKYDSEYIYIGVSNDFNLSLAKQAINDYFKSKEIYLVTGRRNSRKIHQTDAATILRGMLPVEDIILVDLTLSDFLQALKIGVYQVGRVKKVCGSAGIGNQAHKKALTQARPDGS